MTGAQAAASPAREADSATASAVKAFQADGRHAEARERYAELVARHQRRAGRIAFHYLRDSAEADEAVQDAFVRAYSHLSTFREELPFEVWFTRILINGCLDRIKARTRRERWLVAMPESPHATRDYRRASGRKRALARGSAALARTPAAAGGRAGEVAGAAAIGVHVEPLRRLYVARGQCADWTQRIDGTRASVPGHSTAADASRTRSGPGVSWICCGRKAPCQSLTA